jgi:hypothetical protein
MRHALRVDLLSSTLADIAAAKAASIVEALRQQYKAVKGKLGGHTEHATLLWQGIWLHNCAYC